MVVVVMMMVVVVVKTAPQNPVAGVATFQFPPRLQAGR